MTANHIRIVVRDLARNVVQYVGLGDAMRSMGTNPTHDATTITQQVTIQGSKGASGEGEFRGTVMRKERISVLQESDEHQPVVRPVSLASTRNIIDNKFHQPQIRNKIESEDFPKTFVIYPCRDSSKPQENANERDRHLTLVMGHKHG